MWMLYFQTLTFLLAVCGMKANMASAISATKIGAGVVHTCALLDTAQVKCWGGRIPLGIGTNRDTGDNPSEMGNFLPTLDLGIGRTVVELSVGELHNCVLLDNGDLKCWGFNAFGQLGYGDTEDRGDELSEMGDQLPVVDLGTGRTAVQISAGGSQTCAILDNGELKCWGGSFTGQLGYGDTQSRGSAPNQMGDFLPAIDLGTGRTAVQVATGGVLFGSNHTCALLDNGQVKCWGRGAVGNLGYGDILNRGDEPNEMGDNLPAVDLGTGRTAVEIFVSNFHTCALLDNDDLKCWGLNSGGRLGYGDTLGRGNLPNEMGDNLPIVDLGVGRKAVKVTAGGSHTCAILDNNDLKCWGASTFGTIGYEDTESRGDGPNEMGDFLPPIDLGTGRTAQQMALGREHTCALLDNNDVKCWGNGGNGRLGYENRDHVGDESNEMGDFLAAVDLGTPPTSGPTASPTTSSPTSSPTTSPSSAPSLSPSSSPTALPTSAPSKLPTSSPTRSPSPLPTDVPTRFPTNLPTSRPSSSATQARMVYSRCFLLLVFLSFTL